MSKGFNVYIDTSALVAIKFNFAHPAMETFRSGVHGRELQFLSNSILEGEFLEHLSLLLEADRATINKFEFVNLYFKHDVDELIKNISKVVPKEVLAKYLVDFKCKNIDKEIDWKKVFNSYFEKTAPFSGKKKNEFPDAFVVELLKPYMKKNLVIISGDNDFFSWAEKNAEVKVFRSVNAFADFFIKHQREAYNNHFKFFKTHLKQLQAKIETHVAEVFSSTELYSVDSYNSEIDSAEVHGLDLRKINLLKINTLDDIIEIDFHLTGEVELEIVSQVNAFDSIDREDVYIGSNRNSLIVSAEFVGKAEMKLNFKNKKSPFELLIYDEEVHAEEAEIPHEWESFLED